MMTSYCDTEVSGMSPVTGCWPCPWREVDDINIHTQNPMPPLPLLPPSWSTSKYNFPCFACCQDIYLPSFCVPDSFSFILSQLQS